jgi:hypothetical protein
MSEHQLKNYKRRLEDGTVKNATKAREYQLQLSRQLLEDLMAQRGIPYEKEEKIQSLWARYGKSASRSCWVVKLINYLIWLYYFTRFNKFVMLLYNFLVFYSSIVTKISTL